MARINPADGLHRAGYADRAAPVILRALGASPSGIELRHVLPSGRVLTDRPAEVLELAAEREALDGVADPHLGGQMASELAGAYIGPGRHAEAVPKLMGALESFGQMGTWADLAYAENLLGDAHHELGDPARHARGGRSPPPGTRSTSTRDEAAVRAKLTGVS